MTTLLATLPSPYRTHGCGLLGACNVAFLATCQRSADLLALLWRPLSAFAVGVLSARRVFRAVLSGTHQLKVGKPVVGTVPVDVVDVLPSGKKPADVLRHNKAMLGHVAALCHRVIRHSKPHIAHSVNRPTALSAIAAPLGDGSMLISARVDPSRHIPLRFSKVKYGEGVV